MKAQLTIANSLHQQRMVQMKTQPTIAVSLLQVFVSIFLVTMTVAFLTVPFTLSSHPGEPMQKPLSAESSHLT